MKIEEQLFKNMPTKSIKFIDQVIADSLKKDDEEKNRTLLWKNALKSGNIDRELINKISEKNEHILGFIFKSVKNNTYNKIDINKNFNFTEFLEKLEPIQITAKSNKPFTLGLRSFKVISNELKLSKENWNQIISITGDEELVENLDEIIRNIFKFQKNESHKDEIRFFLESIVEPIIERNILTNHESNLLIGILMDTGFQKGKAAKINDNLLVNNNIFYTDIDYLDKKTLVEKIKNKKIRDSILRKYVTEDVDKIKVFLKLNEENIFKTEKTNEQPIFDENIENVLDKISKSSKDSIVMLSIWLNDVFKNKEKIKKLNNLNNEQIEKLINGVDYTNKDSPQINIAGAILKELEEKSEYELSKIKIPFLKKLLEKTKEIPGKNSFLSKYYLNKKYDNILDITEEEFKSYVSYIDIKSVKISNTNGTSKKNILSELLDTEIKNKKKTQGLLEFILDIVDFKDEKFELALIQLMNEIKKSQQVKDYENLKDKINGNNLEKIIFKEKLKGSLAISILENISKIEKIWWIVLNKENIVNNIDVENIDFKYKTKRFNYVMNLNILGREKLINVEKEEVINTTLWNQLIEQTNFDGKRVFSNENINNILNSVNIKRSWVRKGLINSLFQDEENDNKFIKLLIKEEPEIFEKLINKIIDETIKEKKSNLNFHVEEVLILTDLTKSLLKLKEGVEFKEEIILKAFNESDKDVEKSLFHKAGVLSFMDEEELNNIDIAYDLVKRNKNNFYKLGKQLVEFLQLNIENGEDILEKYSRENTKGVLKIFKRKEKEKLQEKIVQAIKYSDSQQVNIEKIQEELNKINYNKNLSKEELDKINEVMSCLSIIKKEDLKEMSITDNADLKRCMENSFIKVIKNYSKLSITDKQDSPDLIEDFNNIMNYCLKEIKEKCYKSTTSIKYK